MLKQALAIFEKTLGSDHPDTARCCTQMAHACRAQGKQDMAEACCKQALAAYEKAPGADPAGYAKALDESAAVLRKTKRAAEAEKIEAHARLIREKQAPAHDHKP